MKSIIFLLIIFIGLGITNAFGQIEYPLAQQEQPVNEATKSKLLSVFGKLPLHFVANCGQFPEEAVYYAKSEGATVYCTEQGLVFGFAEGSISLKFSEDRRVKPEARSELEGKVNYFIGNNSALWRAGIPTFREVVYREVYPGIDLVYSGNQRRLKYTFYLKPNSDPNQILMIYDGTEGLWIDDATGELVIQTEWGEMRDAAPVAYQEIEGVRKAIDISFRLMGEKQVGFTVGDYDPNFMLTLDPAYSTYLGGSNSDSGYGIAVDNSGNAYVTGQTWYFGFPTQNPYQSSHGGGNVDAFVTKLSSSGDALIYSTYLGGSSSDYGQGIAVDSSGDAYVTGHTYSTDFPTTQNPYQRSNNGGRDAFVTKLSSNGNKLIYSTYIGGKDWDESLSIAVDSYENAYVTGCTNSSDFPTQSPYRGSRDAFVTKLSSNGDTLIYFTYIGGSDWDEGKGIAVDNSENVYVTGYTKSSNFPAKNNPYQSNHAGNDDAFVTKLSINGNIIYSTYLGGLYDDSGNGIAIDSDGNVYVTGSTSSPNFPIQNPYQSSNAGGKDAFVTKLSIDGNTIYSTYFGGLYDDSGNGIAVDSFGNAYVTGYTSSPNFPVQNPYQGSNAGSKDAYVTKLSSNGNTLLDSTYLGGLYDDSGNGIDVDSSGNIYVTGYTLSPNFPTQNPYQRRTAGSHDVFVASFWAPPKITEISPESGSPQGGTLVTIKGDNFFEGVIVPFGSQLGRVIKVSRTKIEILTPPLERKPNIRYKVDVMVQNPDGQSYILNEGFVYKPVIEDISPKGSKPSEGIEITIKGYGFYKTPEGILPQVVIGNNSAEVTDCSDTQIKAKAPSLDVSQPTRVNVVVKNPDGQSDTKVNGFLYTEALRIDEISPISGRPEGGTEVTISGQWFMEGATVTFGGNTAKIIPLSDTKVKVITPSLTTNQPKEVDVVITNPDGQSDTEKGGFIYTEAPRIDNISPISGIPKGGTEVTISGQWFMDKATVTFGGNHAEILALSANEVKVITPPLPTEKPQAVNIVVRNPDGQSYPQEGEYILYTYTEPPRIDTISPNIGTPKGGTEVTLSGQWFMPKDVLFGNQPAEVKDSSATHITVVAPPLATEQLPKRVDVIVVNKDNQSSPKADFVYTEAPRIEKFSPISGTPKGGTVVTISGNYFIEGISVTFGNKPATIRKVSPTAIEIFTPPLEVEKPTEVDVMVENPYGQHGTSVDRYVYTESPRIDTISPSNGPPDGGTLVTISGQWFMEKATVFLDDKQATIVQPSTNRIEISTPPVETKQPRQVDVVVMNPDGKSDIEKFIYTRAPQIDNISPDSGAPQGGTIVKISGQWFFKGVTVTFGEKPATIIPLSATEIQVITPPLETTEPKEVNVVVKNPYEEQSNIHPFTYTETPQIDKISPEFSAPEGGIFVTITGKWFFNNDVKVTFDAVPAKVTQSSATSIEVVAPLLKTDEPKKVDIVVENPNGQCSKPFVGFVYTREPEIEKIYPVNGKPQGGTQVTITGKWFMKDVTVTFGKNPVESVKWLSYTTIEVFTPLLAVEHPTPVDVAVTNVYGQSGKCDDGFIYTEEPHIEKISPISGTPNVGTQITISGKWFIDGSRVIIEETEASKVEVKSDTEIIAITPKGSLGKKDVIVINPYSQVGVLPGGFEYRKGPVIQRIHPVAGPLAGNTQLTINGSGFVEGATVRIREKTALVIDTSESQLTAITPPSAEGLKDVIVINPDGQQSNPAKFNYVDFPGEIRIYNFPNPFQTGQNTMFRYKGGNGKKVEIKIFNLAGELVQSLSKEGGETIDWDGRDLEGDKVPPGLYPYVYLLNGKFEQRQLLQVIK